MARPQCDTPLVCKALLLVRRFFKRKAPLSSAVKSVAPINMYELSVLFGPCPHRAYYCIGSNFWKFYLMRTGFTLCELVSLVKVFRLLRLERNFFGVQSVDTVGRCTTSLSIGRASVFVMPC
jgi:hypothetical protein